MLDRLSELCLPIIDNLFEHVCHSRHSLFSVNLNEYRENFFKFLGKNSLGDGLVI